MPSSSSARSRNDSVRGLMPASDRSSSQKRERPSARSRITRRVHLPQTTSAVRHTGQLSSGEAMSLPRWYRETSGNEVADQLPGSEPSKPPPPRGSRKTKEKEGGNRLRVSEPSKPPAPPLPPVPADTALMTPSDGCTS